MAMSNGGDCNGLFSEISFTQFVQCLKLSGQTDKTANRSSSRRLGERYAIATGSLCQRAPPE